MPGEQIAAKYASFNIIDIAYKHVNGTSIPTSVLVPKKLTPGKHPVLVRWHGGGCGTGHRLFAEWFGDWTLNLALQHSAIIISPDYRLMPESKGVDILQDARDFYIWLFNNASQILPTGIDVDLAKILVTGESAGGWLALQAGFLIPDRVAAIISHYPMVDMRSPHFTEKYEKQLMDTPQIDPQVLDDYVAKIEPGSIVTSRNPPDGPEFVAIMFQQGSFPKYFGTEKELYPLEMLENATSFPPTWLIHGTKDSMVPVASTEKFASALKKVLPETPMYVTLQEGEEHGFDLHDAASGASASLETAWVKPGLEFVDKYWPSKA
ncbi:putative carboxylesterase M8 [Pseudocercospora fuligena]|uniref:Putative carboxylesterase M8 n=1 Tax=Pseudocercospora fuligena TaxID=685502 RepID=A0A8H6VK22_9PEZI|nr:putative carboxylesterase M8 [Pseudocercospora fuligena]